MSELFDKYTIGKKITLRPRVFENKGSRVIVVSAIILARSKTVVWIRYLPDNFDLTKAEALEDELGALSKHLYRWMPVSCIESGAVYPEKRKIGALCLQ